MPRNYSLFSVPSVSSVAEGLGFAFPGFQNETVKELVIRGPAGRGVLFLLYPGQESIDLRIQVIQLMEQKRFQRLGPLGRAESIFSMVAENNVFQPEGQILGEFRYRPYFFVDHLHR